MKFDEYKMQEVYDTMPESQRLAIKRSILSDMFNYSLMRGKEGDADILQSLIEVTSIKLREK